MSEKLDRRQLLKLLALATGTSAVAYAKLNSYLKTKAQHIGTDVFLPNCVKNTPKAGMIWQPMRCKWCRY